MSDLKPDPLGAIADERRERVEEAQKARLEELSLEPRNSNLVVMDDHAEVVYTVHPSHLPFTAVNGLEMIERLNQRFGVSFQAPNLGNPLDASGSPQLTPEQVQELPRHIHASQLTLTFKDGFVSLNAGGAPFAAPTQVKEITFTREHISVKLTGRSDLAEMIVKECWEILWDLAKGQVPRTFDELSKSGLQIVEQGNSTTVDLGINPKDLFRSDFIKAIDELIGRPGNLASNFRKVTYATDEAIEKKAPTISLDDIVFKVQVPNVGGETFEAVIRFSVTRKTDLGSNRITITTQLPYNDHMNVVEAIVESVS